jgi:selenocysteine lyase/cysteine desulfurase
MGVLYGKYDLLDRLTTYKVRPASKDPPGKFETGTGNFEGMCGVLGALEYIEWVGETFGAEHAERCVDDYTGRRLSFKLGMSAIRSYEFELSRLLLDILIETPGVTVYGITDTRRLKERVPTAACLHHQANILARWRRSWTKLVFTSGIGIIMPWRSPSALGWKTVAAWCEWDRCTTTRWKRSSGLEMHWGG